MNGQSVGGGPSIRIYETPAFRRACSHRITHSSTSFEVGPHLARKFATQSRAKEERYV